MNTKHTSIKESAMKRTSLALLSALCLAAPAAAQEIAAQQQALSDRLDSIEATKRGFSIYGRFDSKVSSATASGDMVDDKAGTREYDGYTQADLDFEFRASEEFRALVELRVHQDWNNYYDEGINPLVLRWMNLEGKILGGHASYELGDFRFKHSPLTVWTPGLMNLEFEPAVFAERRAKAMAEAGLAADNTRHLQGANIHWTSGANDPNRIDVTVMGARMRTPWANTGIIQYYNSDVEKYAGLFGVSGTLLDAVTVGASASTTYDRIRSSRAYNYIQANYPIVQKLLQAYGDQVVVDGDSIWGRFYERNYVVEGSVGFDLAKLLKSSSLVASVTADFALSFWDLQGDTYAPIVAAIHDSIAGQVNGTPTTIDSSAKWNLPGKSVPGQQTADNYEMRLDDYDELYRQFAALVTLNVGWRSKPFAALLDAKWMRVDAGYVADMAQSTAYEPRNISASFANPVILDLDGLYNSAYVIDPITMRNSQEVNNPLEAYYYNGTNNYLRQAFVKNAYTDDVSSYMERRDGEEVNSLAFEGILPNGYATPNRTGFDLALHLAGLDNAVEATALFTALDDLDKANPAGKTSYGRWGAGATVRLGALVGWKDGIELNGGYVHNDIELKKVHDYEMGMLSAGLTFGFFRDHALLAGYQRLENSGTYAGLPVDLIQQNLSFGVRSKISEAGTLTLSYTRICGENSDGDELVTLNVPAVSFSLQF